jgi:four helix bundle protein
MGLNLEDFDAYQKATEFSRSVIALLERSAFGKERKLREQITEASDSISANLAEGFEQPTDRAFGNYVFHSKGSTAEVLARLRQAQEKKCITQQELEFHLRLGDEVCRLLAGLARYLYKSDFKDRGRYKATHRPGETQEPETQTSAAHDDPGTRDSGRRTRDPGPRTRDQGPRTRDQGPRTRDQGPKTSDQGPRTRDQGPKTRDQGPSTRPGTQDERRRTQDERPGTQDERRVTKD